MKKKLFYKITILFIVGLMLVMSVLTVAIPAIRG